tara:strand:- start:361 stop:1641 length:1281 start_codon:yes stop_codon:yes gene_type:complete
MTDDHYEKCLAAIAAEPALQGENVRLPESAGAGLRGGLAVLGVACLALTALGAVVHSPAHALASFEVGVFVLLAICLGSLFFTMLFQAMNAYWPVTLRRQMEHAAGLIWLPLLGMLAVIVIELLSSVFTGHGVLFQWLDENPGYLLDHKDGYLNLGGLLVRFVIYGAIWLFLARSILSMSLEQDATGSREITRAIRRRASWGLLAFALSVAFASFDFLMSLDYRFYSTMWGVYFFAGAAMSALAVTTITFSVLRLTGRLTGVVTDEHYHDLGKLLFAFGACFWAYIAFSQYFLIWYGNIPEETAFYLYRKQGGWEHLSMILVIGHFIIPFLILISRKVKRNVLFAAVMAAYLLIFQVLDMIWIIRPMAYVNAESPAGPGSWWIDVVAAVGALALFASFMMRSLVSAPLIPMKDPRLGRTLEHKNYV